MRSIKKGYLLLLLLLSNQAIAQFGGFIDIEKIYFGSDVFMPAHYKKNDFKLGISNQLNNNTNIHNSLKLAYSFNNNLFVKSSYKRKKYNSINNVWHAYFDIDEYDVAIGFHKHLNPKKYNERKNKEEVLRRKWKNEHRSLRGKSPKFYNDKIKETGFILETALGYGNANLMGIDSYPRYNTDFVYITVNTLEYNLERLNLDLAFYFLTRSKIELSYNFRTSLVNFKSFNILELSPPEAPNFFNSYLTTLEFVKLNDPFLVFKSNLKFALNFDYYNVYVKVNDIIGRANHRFQDGAIKYSNIAYNISFVLGFSLDIDALAKF